VTDLLSEKCLVCENSVESVIKLPKLPLTGVYGTYKSDNKFATLDQELLLCDNCTHAQLKHTVDATQLYGKNYYFRTSGSKTSRQAAEFFVKYLNKLFPKRIFDLIVDFGCNDAYLLKLLKNRSKQLLGIDPIWKGRESDFQDEKIQVLGRKIEQIDFKKESGIIPDLIVSQHTLEHIARPKELLEMFFNISNDDTIFVFEFPCFDVLLEKFRFDQVFHEHLQYFSFQSFLTLLKQIGGELIDFTFNFDHWGALVVAFRKTTKPKTQMINKLCLDRFPLKNNKSIQSFFNIFCKQMEATKFALDQLKNERLYGYGAALTLPVLGYHLQIDFSGFHAILDDDPKKKGLGYINLPVEIAHPTGFDYSEASICLTALDNRRPILKKLLNKKPRHIINPLNFL